MTDQLFPDSQLVDRIGDRVRRGIGIRSGYQLLDWATKGLEPNVYWVIGGDTSHGKSTLAQNIAFNVATFGEPITYISSEMRQELFYSRLGTIATGLNPSHQNLTELEIEMFLTRIGEIRTMPVEFHYETRYFEIKRIVERRWSKVYIVDYLQELRAGNEMRDRRELVSTLTRNLEQLSKEQEVCIIALSQFARPQQGIPGTGGAGIHSFKESGEIENSADIAILLEYKWQRLKAADNPDAAEQLVIKGEEKRLRLNVVKNRIHGNTLIVDLNFDRRTLQITNQGG